MNCRARSLMRRRQGGSMAVEAAIIISLILAPIIFIVCALGKFFWYYTAVQKSIHDGALYLSAAPFSEIRNQSAQRFATDIINTEISALDSSLSVQIFTNCGYCYSQVSFAMAYVGCTDTTVPDAVQTVVMVTFFDSLNSDLFPNGFQFTLNATMAYGGR